MSREITVCAAHEDFVPVDPDGDAPHAGVGCRYDLERTLSTERIEELDLRPAPGGFLADVAIGEEVHVVAQGECGFFELVHPRIDRASRVMELGFARVQPQRFLGIDDRLRKPAACRQAACAPMSGPRLRGRNREGRVIRGVGIFEQPVGPECVAMHGRNVGRGGMPRAQRRGFLIGPLEVADAQLRQHQADTRSRADRLGRKGALVRLGGIRVPALGQQQVAQLYLDLGRGRLRRRLGGESRDGKDRRIPQRREESPHLAFTSGNKPRSRE